MISPSGHEVGPFLSIEQAALAHVVPSARRTEVFAWYTLAGSVATALGALCGGAASGIVQNVSFFASDSYRAVVLLYAALGAAFAFLFWVSRLRVTTATKAQTRCFNCLPHEFLRS